MLKVFFLLLSLLLPAVTIGETRMKVNEYTTTDGLPHRTISNILQDKQGLMWFATWNGLCSFDGKQFRTYNQLDSVKIGRIDRVSETSGGDLWCQGYNNRNYLFNTQTGVFNICDSLPTLLPSRNILREKIKCSDKGLIISSPLLQETFEFEVNENKALEATLHAIYGDKQGNVWANYNDRLYKFSFLPIRYRYQKRISDSQSPLFNNEIRAIMIDSDNRRWVGCKNRCIYVYDHHEKLLGYLTKEGKISKTPVEFGALAYHFREDKQRNIWIATKGNGLFRMAPTAAQNSFKATHYHTGTTYPTISNDNLYYLVPDGKNNLWAATFGSGIDQIQLPLAESPENQHIQSHFKNFYRIFPHNRKGIRVRHMAFLTDDILAVGTTDGLVVCDLKNKTMQTISNDNTMQILKSKGGKIYVATLGQGLKELVKSGENWELASYKAKQGEIADIIVSIIEDLDEHLWLVSDSHLTRLRPTEQIAEKYDESFFNRSLVFSEALPVSGQRGELFFGTASGIIRFNPREVRKDSAYVPKLLFTNLKLEKEGKEIYSDSLTQLILDNDNQGFAAEFSALDYVNPDKIKYAYSLEKANEPENWIYIHNHHSVSFNRLKPGDYVLKVKSTNSDGVWVDNQRSIAIEVMKPSLWPFYTGLAGLLLLISLGASYLKKKKHPIAVRGEMPEERELNPSCPEIKSQDDIFIEKIMAYMEENMDNPDLSVDTFASYLGYSRSRFYKQMKAAINKTPVDFIREMRIKRATYLLDSRQYNVSEVAFMIGFSDSKYFSKVFKKETGFTPTEYLNREKEE